MTALVPVRGLADSLAELFEPVDADPIAALLEEYNKRRASLVRVADLFSDEDTAAVLPHFVKGNEVDRHGYVSADCMFKLSGALAHLNATFWDRALSATDVLDCMPADRRKQWREQIDKCDVPEFNEETLRSTLSEHLAARHRYFAERVDGLFRALSPCHKTNLPSGFRSTLILNYVFDKFGFNTQSRLDTLTDLRVIVAKFMGRTDIGEGGYCVRSLTGKLVDYARQERCGEWVALDGGAIEVKAHKCGTCHVRLHDEISWRLNAVLASIHPGAIPESARTRPKRGKGPKKPATVELIERPLPFAVVRALADFKPADGRYPHGKDGGGLWLYGYEWSDLDKHVRAEVGQVLTSIGGVDKRGDWGSFEFDYNPHDVLREIVASGCVPDQRAHQFYPTPPALAARAVELADIGPADIILEPSAGQGAIAELLPKDRTTCIEASALHCAVLRAKGFDVVEGDFLSVTVSDVGTHQRVVMNPPFDRGQWRAHVEHAARFLVGPGAQLVAILPASAPTRSGLLPGWSLTWSDPIERAFAGTSISVVILVAEPHECNGD